MPDNRSITGDVEEVITPQPVTLRVQGTPSSNRESIGEQYEEIEKLNLTRQSQTTIVPSVDIPLRYGPVDGYLSSGFGPRWGRLHKGIDIAAPTGTEILALADGLVVRSGRANGYGNVVVIQHGYGQETLYAHMSQRSVRVGNRVTRGEKIGEVGSTGHATGPHVHLEIHINGIAVNPLQKTALLAAK